MTNFPFFPPILIATFNLDIIPDEYEMSMASGCVCLLFTWALNNAGLRVMRIKWHEKGLFNNIRHGEREKKKIKKMIGYKNDNKFLFVLRFFSWLLCARAPKPWDNVICSLIHWYAVRRDSMLFTWNAFLLSLLLLFVCRCCWCLAFCSLYLRLKIFQAFWVLLTEWSPDLRRPGKKPTQFSPSILLNYFVIFLCRHFKSNVFCDLNIYFFLFVAVTHGTTAICMDSAALTQRRVCLFLRFEAALFYEYLNRW